MKGSMPPVRVKQTRSTIVELPKLSNAARAREANPPETLQICRIKKMPPVRKAEKLGEVGLKKRKQRKSTDARRLIL